MNDQKLENILNLALSSTEEERQKSLSLIEGYDASDDTWEVIIKYTGNIESIRQTAEEVTALFGGFAILRIREERLDTLTQIPEVTYVEKPKPFYFSVNQGKEASCFAPVQRGAGALTGKGVLFCCVDSGVSYLHPEFRNADGSTRILYLWDQTISGNPPKGYARGTEFTKSRIDEALQAQSPEMRRNIVPSVDISGHGTAVLGIGAGNSGVAYEADLIVVKLGTAEADGFPRTTRLMEGIDYCIRKAAELSMPAAINLSIGNNYGAHEPYN